MSVHELLLRRTDALMGWAAVQTQTQTRDGYRESQRLGLDCAAHKLKTRQMTKSRPVTLSLRILMIQALPLWLGMG